MSQRETYGDTDMLNLLRGVRRTRRDAETLHPSVRGAVQEDDRGLDELGGGVLAVVARSAVPSPSQLRESPEEAREGYETVAPEDTTL